MQCLSSERRKRKTDSLNGINKIIRLMRQICAAYTSIHHRLACKIWMMLQFVYVFKSGLRYSVSMRVYTKRNVLMVACMCLPHGVERVCDTRRCLPDATLWRQYSMNYIFSRLAVTRLHIVNIAETFRMRQI